jgi:hypothetical protein
MSKRILAILALSALLFSCKKDGDDIVAGTLPDEKKYDVITTAALYNTADGSYEATYWFNEKRNTLETGGADQTTAYGIEKHSTDIYIAGAYANTKSADDRLLPCYWKNGKKINLTDGLDIEVRSGASDLKWFNNALYISGDADLEPVLWKVTNGALEYVTRFGTAGNIVGLRKTGNIQIFNGKLCIGGSRKKTVNGNTVYDVGYWTVDANDQYDYIILQDNLSYALGFSISVSEKEIYIIGEGGTRQHPVPMIWTKTGQHPVSTAFNANNQRLHTGVSDSKGNLFLNVLDIQLYQPVIWKVYGTGTYELIKPIVPAGTQGMCKSLDIKDDQLAYVYNYIKDQKGYAAYVFDGKTVELNINETHNSTISSLRLFPR